MNNKFSEFFKDGDGMFSMMRLCLFLVVVSVLCLWIWASYQGKPLQEIPEGIKWMLGIFCGAKVTQSFAENKAPENK